MLLIRNNSKILLTLCRQNFIVSCKYKFKKKSVIILILKNQIKKYLCTGDEKKNKREKLLNDVEIFLHFYQKTTHQRMTIINLSCHGYYTSLKFCNFFFRIILI